MTKRNNTPSIFLFFYILLVFSCTDSLEITPISSISVTSFWESSDDARGGLAGMYNQFRGLGEDLFNMGAARSEIMGAAPIRNASYRIKYFENTLNAGIADLGWQQPYTIIGAANLIIANVPDIQFSGEAEKNNILAQAYAMRAYMYFVLARTWGDIPMVTEPTRDFTPQATFKERAPVEQVFTLIKDDIDQALSLFPDSEFPSGRAQWSKPATHMLKGKVYLWTGKRMDGGTEDFTTALSALEEAETADVQLLDNYSEIFDYDNKGNQEIIFAIHYDGLETEGSYYVDMYTQLAAVRNSFEQTIERLSPAGLGYWEPSEYVRNQFNDDDTRKDATFYNLYLAEDSSLYASALIKYDGLVEGNTRRFIDDIVIYRYAELLLLKAEVKNALGQDPTPEMNEIRQRAYGENYEQHVFISGSQEENDEVILQERLFELGWEGTRWWDLLRFGKAYELVPALQGRETEVPLLFPVDEGTLTRNSSLTQTPGY